MVAALGPLSLQMAVHILLMNAVAPLVALAVTRIVPRQVRPGRMPDLVFLAMGVQLLVLWSWHAPPAVDAALRFHWLHLLMQASLLASASWFWWSVLSCLGNARWRAILALLLTSKLFCLLGVLLLLAPRPLYLIASAHGEGTAPAALGDQQLAGLMMLVACPATYVLAGIVIATQWFTELSRSAPGARHGTA